MNALLLMRSSLSPSVKTGASWRRRQQGAVAVIVGLSMTILVAFVGLALDLGKLYVVKTELQNSADACALAAAQALTGANGQQLAIAEAAGMTVAARHKVLFQAHPVTTQENSSVEFSTTANGFYANKTGPSANQALTMRYARCKLGLSNIDTWFIHVLNILPGIDIGLQQVNAQAVATLQGGQRTCALPVAICSEALTSATRVGDWLQGALDSKGGQRTGSFNWADLDPKGGGAKELANLLEGDGACDLPSIGTQVGQPGSINSLAAAWNTRFGIYAKSKQNKMAGFPDWSGYSYGERSWPKKKQAFDDFVTNQRSKYAPYQGDKDSDFKPSGTAITSANHKAEGRDRRLAVAPVVKCADFDSKQTAAVVSWACIFLLHPINNGSANNQPRMLLEYRGNAGDVASPCVSNGLPGTPTGNGPLVTALVR